MGSDLDSADDLEERRLALDEQRHKDNVQLRRSVLALRARELRLGKPTPSKPEEPRRRVWAGPFGIAVIGGLITVMGGIVGSLIEGARDREERTAQFAENLAMERQRFEATLVENAVKSASDSKAAATNLRFLVDSGLVTRFEELPKYLAELSATDEGYTALPSGETYTPPRSSAPAGSWEQTRRPIDDPDAAPWNSIVLILLDGGMVSHAGFAIAPDRILTIGGDFLDHVAGQRVRCGVNPGAEERRIQSVVDLKPEEDGIWIAVLTLDAPIPGSGVPVTITATDPIRVRGDVTVPGVDNMHSELSRLYVTTGPLLPSSTDTNLRYELASAHGSLGMPVLQQARTGWQVVGIHHSGRFAGTVGLQEGVGFRLTAELRGKILQEIQRR